MPSRFRRHEVPRRTMPRRTVPRRTMPRRTVQRLTLGAACLAQGMMVLDVMIVNVALPDIQHQLHASPERLEWVVSAYALALGALIPVGGVIGDHFGRKRVFLAGMVIFVLASVACAISTSDVELIGWRVVQGVGGAVMASLTLSIISEAFPPSERAGPIGLWAAVGGLGVAAGTVAGGLLLSVFPWSSIFWVNVPIGAVGLAVGWFGIEESRDPRARSFDLIGTGLSAAGLFLVTFGFVEAAARSWGSPVVGGSLAAGCLVLAGFFLWERYAADPMVPPALFRSRTFSMASLTYLLAYLSFAGFIYYVTLLFQNVRQWSPLHTGLTWLFFCVPYFATAQLGRRISRWLSRPATVAGGCLLAALGTGLMSQVGESSPLWFEALDYVLVGVGFGLMVPAGSDAAMSEVPPGSSGAASGVFNASRQIGTAIGLGLIGSIGVAAATNRWHALTGGVGGAGGASGASGAGGGEAGSVTSYVAGGQVGQVTRRLGSSSGAVAAQAFEHGFEVALLVSAAVILVAAAVGWFGLRRRAGRAAPLTGSGASAAGAVPPA